MFGIYSTSSARLYLETHKDTIVAFSCLCNLELLNMYSNDYAIVKWQGLPVLIGALLNAHHALHP